MVKVMEPYSMKNNKKQNKTKQNKNKKTGNIQIEKEKKGSSSYSKFLEHCHMKCGLDLHWVAPEVRAKTNKWKM